MQGPFGKNKPRRRVLINLAPMIDILMILLIFFMVSSSFRKHQAIDVSLPKAETGAASEAPPHEIVVDKEGDLSWENQSISREALRGALRALMKDAPETPVVLRADEAAPFQAVVDVMDMARSVGGTRLVIPTESLPRETEESEVGQAD
jgi:biopolymer transport protein ExbD